jgi:hypothetical protein
VLFNILAPGIIEQQLTLGFSRAVKGTQEMSVSSGRAADPFSIVGAGADSSRDGLRCPGVAHAGAYPIEVVVARDGGAVRMPGSIRDKIARQVRGSVGGR